MQAGSLARRYARAIMDLAVAANVIDQVAADLRGLAAAYKTAPELGEVLGNHSYPKAKRRAIVDALLARLAAQPLTKTFCNLLLDNERLAVVPDIAREVDAMVEERAGRVAAEVVSATVLTPAQVTQLTATLERLSGKKVVLSKREDPTLLGGVVAKVGDVVYDGSLRTQLRVLRDELSR
ncbi:MAG: ATP synthase F1 subunit delta [Myxococcales bacterium]|nr:ATP synthase F1 subunit delta [Myxococcales bacterium]